MSDSQFRFKTSDPGLPWWLRLHTSNVGGLSLIPGQGTRVLPRERIGHSKHPLPTTQEKTPHGHHQMVNTKIRLIIFFAAKDGEALYSHQKQD